MWLEWLFMAYPHSCGCRDRMLGCRPAAGDNELLGHQHGGLGVGQPGSHPEHEEEGKVRHVRSRTAHAPFGPQVQGFSIRRPGLWPCMYRLSRIKLLVLRKLLLEAHFFRATIALSHVPF